MSYYIGVYQDGKGKVLQASDDIDCLSCEILAKPGVLELPTVKMLIEQLLKGMARRFECHHIEINASRGKGSYRYMKGARAR